MTDAELKDTIAGMLAVTPNTQGNQQLIARMQDLLAAPVVRQVPYTYSAVWWTTGAANNLAAGAVDSPQNIVIRAEADFLVLAKSFDANTANAARNPNNFVIPNVRILETNLSTGFQYMDQRLPVPAMFGGPNEPQVSLPVPLLWQAKTTIQILASNYDAAAGYNLFLLYSGVQLYTP
jgi:hypothetical protein